MSEPMPSSEQDVLEILRRTAIDLEKQSLDEAHNTTDALERAVAMGSASAWASVARAIQRLRGDHPLDHDDYIKVRVQAQLYHAQIVDMVALAFRVSSGDANANEKLTHMMIAYLSDVVEKYPDLRSLIPPNQVIQ